MNTATYRILLEKCGAEAFCSAIAVCLISAFIKKKFNLDKRMQTAVEVLLSFIVAWAVAYAFKGGDYTDVVTSGLGTAGVALAVCGFICGDKKMPEITDDTIDIIVNLKSESVEDIKEALLSLPDVKFTDDEAEAIAFLVSKLKRKE